MKKIALLAAVLATVSLGACTTYHQQYKGDGVGMNDEAAARAAVYGSADKTSKVK